MKILTAPRKGITLGARLGVSDRRATRVGGDVVLKGCSHGTAHGAVGLLEDSYLERYTRLSVIRWPSIV